MPDCWEQGIFKYNFYISNNNEHGSITNVKLMFFVFFSFYFMLLMPVTVSAIKIIFISIVYVAFIAVLHQYQLLLNFTF